MSKYPTEALKKPSIFMCKDKTAKQHLGLFNFWYSKSVLIHPTCPKCKGHKTERIS